MDRSDYPELCRHDGIVRLHGHRGARGLMPENTMAGFHAAIAAGVSIVELDVLATRDEIPVITHNPMLAACGTRDAAGRWLTGDGPVICRLTYAELAQYDVGGCNPESAYGRLWPEQMMLDRVPIPRLSDLCALASHPGHEHVWLNIEIKSNPLEPGLTFPPYRVARLVVNEAFAARLSDRVLLQSFDWRVLHALKAIKPQIPRSYLTYLPKPNPKMPVTIYDGSLWMDGQNLASAGGRLPRLIRRLGGINWSPWAGDITASDVAEAQKEGLIVTVWTVNEPGDIDRMIDFGVDGIITDYPERVQKALINRDMHWTKPPIEKNRELYPAAQKVCICTRDE